MAGSQGDIQLKRPRATAVRRGWRGEGGEGVQRPRRCHGHCGTLAADEGKRPSLSRNLKKPRTLAEVCNFQHLRTVMRKSLHSIRRLEERGEACARRAVKDTTVKTFV